MSSYKTPEIFTYVAEADLSGRQYTFVKHGTADDGVVAAAANEQAFGICANDPVGQIGEEIEVYSQNGGGLIKVAAVLAAGSLIKSDANGQAVVAADRSEALGMLDESATAIGDIVACVLF